MFLKRSLFIGCILLSALLLVSCPVRQQKTAVLCTDHPEFTSYVESFNTSQDEYRIIIAYGNDPRLSIPEDSKCEYDLIIDSHINSGLYLQKFASLEQLFLDEVLSADDFYAQLLKQGRYNEQQVLLPVSFNLPVLIFKTNAELGDEDSYMLSLEQIAELNTNFSTSTEKGFSTLGLSLRWDPEMLYLVTLLHNTAYHESETGSFLWNAESLKSSVDYMRTWTNDLNGGISSEREFAQKFMVEPPYNLVSKNRILCYYSDLAGFYNLTPQKRDDLQILWPAADNRIPVLSDILFAAIPQGARGAEAAKAFLAWFFQQQTQDDLLSSTQYKRLRTFGIAGGFSALKRVNEQVLPTYYPEMVGLVPGAEYLSFPLPLPQEWPLIKSEVLLPWLTEQADKDVTDELMRERLELWMRQRSPR